MPNVKRSMLLQLLLPWARWEKEQDYPAAPEAAPIPEIALQQDPLRRHIAGRGQPRKPWIALPEPPLIHTVPAATLPGPERAHQPVIFPVLNP